MKIKCNNKPRQFIYGYELTNKEKKEFDYIAPDELNSHAFVRYKGNVYDVSEFMRVDKYVAVIPQHDGGENWHGYTSDSFFSGVLVRFLDDGESVIIATYSC